MKKSIVLLSGGVDSSTCLALAKEDTEVVAISFDYGQRHEGQELKAAKEIAKYYDVKHRIISLKDIFKEGKSSLTDASKEVTVGGYGEQEEMNTEVEFRNGVFLSICTSLAQQENAYHLYYGAHQDEMGEVYADTSDEFIETMEKLIHIGTNGEVELVTPFAKQTKVDIVGKGLELKVPYEKTYSCYNGTVPPCGECGTCIDRQKAFEENGVKDPALEK